MCENKSIEQRIEELENLVYLNKNVLSFEEASPKKPTVPPSKHCKNFIVKFPVKAGLIKNTSKPKIAKPMENLSGIIYNLKSIIDMIKH